jgi:hypothetical protein
LFAEAFFYVEGDGYDLGEDFGCLNAAVEWATANIETFEVLFGEELAACFALFSAFIGEVGVEVLSFGFAVPDKIYLLHVEVVFFREEFARLWIDKPALNFGILFRGIELRECVSVVYAGNDPVTNVKCCNILSHTGLLAK